MAKTTEDSGVADMEQKLLCQFSLYPGMDLFEATRRYIDANRHRVDPGLLMFLAACAIQIGNKPFATVLLGQDISRQSRP